MLTLYLTLHSQVSTFAHHTYYTPYNVAGIDRKSVSGLIYGCLITFKSVFCDRLSSAYCYMGAGTMYTTIADNDRLEVRTLSLKNFSKGAIC